MHTGDILELIDTSSPELAEKDLMELTVPEAADVTLDKEEHAEAEWRHDYTGQYEGMLKTY